MAVVLQIVFCSWETVYIFSSLDRENHRLFSEACQCYELWLFGGFFYSQDVCLSFGKHRLILRGPITRNVRLFERKVSLILCIWLQLRF